MKQILYDMGPLTLVRWLLQRALKFEPPFEPRSKLKRGAPKIEKNKCVLGVTSKKKPVYLQTLSK